MEFLLTFALLDQWIPVVAKTNLICQSLCVFTWPVLSNQNWNLLRSNYNFSQHIRAEAPNKKLTCIHIETAYLIGGVVKSNLWTEQMKEIVWARNPFHLTQVQCSRHISFILIVIKIWSYGYSKCSDTNVDIKEKWTVVPRVCY